jgi:phytoene synthase
MPPSSYGRAPDASSAGALAALRARDPARFFAVLFAPPDRREALAALHGFAIEIARAGQVTREPLIAAMRLTWWREVLDGAARAHEVAAPLAAALRRGALAPDALAAIIDAEETALADGIGSEAAWQEWLFATAGAVSVAAGRLLGAPRPEALAPLGAADAAARALLAGPGRGVRALLPPGVAPAALAARAETWAVVPDLPRAALAAALPAVPARRALAAVRAGRGWRFGTGDRLAMLAAWARGHV